MQKANGLKDTDTDFDKRCDLNDDGSIQILDKTVLTKNNGNRRKIIDYEGGTK